jgi:hypothetical protein
MVSDFFHRPSRSLAHHTVSLLPEVEAIIRTSVSHFVEHATRRTGELVTGNFSISTNLIVLARLTSLLTEQRKGRKPDPDALEWLLDLVDGKRHVNDQDLQDYAHFLTQIAEAYNKRHPSAIYAGAEAAGTHTLKFRE